MVAIYSTDDFLKKFDYLGGLQNSPSWGKRLSGFLQDFFFVKRGLRVLSLNSIVGGMFFSCHTHTRTCSCRGVTDFFRARCRVQNLLPARHPTHPAEILTREVVQILLFRLGRQLLGRFLFPHQRVRFFLRCLFDHFLLFHYFILQIDRRERRRKMDR